MSHNHKSQKFGLVFSLSIILNTLYVIVEFFYGMRVDSSALIADAWHNASDVFSLILAWIAYKLTLIPANNRFTYGYQKTTILVSFLNGAIIIIAAFFIAWEAIQKLNSANEIPGELIIYVSIIGLFINTGTALLFWNSQKNDLNMRGAFLHMAADAGVTLAVLCGGLSIKFLDLEWIDPLLSILIVIVIIYSSWGLLKESLYLLIDAVPKHLDLEKIKFEVLNFDGVLAVKSIHIWALSTTQTTASMILQVNSKTSDVSVKEISDRLTEKFKLQKTTIELQYED
tara:strand:- start:319 stop:1173 length:855 start_codon:yes stop_codon:yes gene_type:complete